MVEGVRIDRNGLKYGRGLRDALSQAQRVQRTMKRAKEEQIKLRSAFVALLTSGSCDTFGQG